MQRLPRHRPGHAAAQAQLGQERVHRAPALGPAGRRDRLLGGVDQVVDHLGQCPAVPLEERRSLALTVVGQYDDLVRVRQRVDDPLQRAEHAVEAFERLQRLGPGRSGVVGDLVVVDEVAVDDRGALDQLVGDQRDVQIAQQHVGDRAQEDVRAAAVDPRDQVAPALPPGLVQLLDHLADAEHQPAGGALRAGEEPDVARGCGSVGSAARLNTSHRARGVAGPVVADADPAVGEQSAAGRHPRLDLGGVAGPVRDHHPAGLLLVPAERRDLPGAAVQDARLAGRSGRRYAGVPRRPSSGCRPGSSRPDAAGCPTSPSSSAAGRTDRRSG